MVGTCSVRTRIHSPPEIAKSHSKNYRSTAFGFSIIGIFISSNQYIIDAYETYSASALAGAALLRYLVAAAMTVASIPMYRNLGVKWTCTLFGCLGTLMTPVPYLFYVYGPSIRSKSKFARKGTTRLT